MNKQEARAFFSGGFKGFCSGAYMGLVLLGSLAVVAGLLINPAAFFSVPDLLVQCAGSFIFGGCVGVVVGGVAGAIYESTNETIQEAEIQRNMRHIKEVEHNYHIAQVANAPARVQGEAATPAQHEVSAVDRLKRQQPINPLLAGGRG